MVRSFLFYDESMSADVSRLDAKGIAIASWGVVGVLALLGQALYRLTPLAIEPVEAGMLDGPKWALYIGWTIFNAYAEGYRGFQKSFSPRVVARAVHLARHPKPINVLFAPVYCMTLFDASRRRLIVARILVVSIMILVIIVKALPQPWRGIVDAGVVIGLAWGVLVIVYLFARALVTGVVPENDSLPDP
jgi:hypothetical protein